MVLGLQYLSEAQRSVLEKNSRVDAIDADASEGHEPNPNSSQGLYAGSSDDVREDVISSNVAGKRREKGIDSGHRGKRRKTSGPVGAKLTLFNPLPQVQSGSAGVASQDADVIGGIVFISSGCV